MRRFFAFLFAVMLCMPAHAILDCQIDDYYDDYYGQQCTECIGATGCRELSWCNNSSSVSMGYVHNDYLCTQYGFLSTDSCLDGSNVRSVGAACSETRTAQICIDNTIGIYCDGPAIGTATQTSTGELTTNTYNGACRCTNMSAWAITSRTCNAGYFLNGTSCQSCATVTGNAAATSNPGTTSITGCFLPGGTTGSDNTGKYKMTGNCNYS